MVQVSWSWEPVTIPSITVQSSCSFLYNERRLQTAVCVHAPSSHSTELLMWLHQGSAFVLFIICKYIRTVTWRSAWCRVVHTSLPVRLLSYGISPCQKSLNKGLSKIKDLSDGLLAVDCPGDISLVSSTGVTSEISAFFSPVTCS